VSVTGSPRRAPPLKIHVATDGVRVPLGRDRVATLARAVLRAERVTRGTLSITFVDTRTMARLNREHLGHRGPTDIITFELASDAPGAVVGDIYIAPDVARAQAAEHRCGVREELARLVVHGALHAAGWTHPEGPGRTTSPMWRRQERLLAALRTSDAVTA
jgi:probable rRNA maturation factor